MGLGTLFDLDRLCGEQGGRHVRLVWGALETKVGMS